LVALLLSAGLLRPWLKGPQLAPLLPKAPQLVPLLEVRRQELQQPVEPLLLALPLA
jgi:hypothetical protein